LFVSRYYWFKTKASQFIRSVLHWYTSIIIIKILSILFTATAFITYPRVQSTQQRFVSSLLTSYSRLNTNKRFNSRSFASMSFGQFAATSQFYLYGKWHCTRTGWETASKKYPKPDILEDPNLSLVGKVFLITGANAGIGREISSFAASKGAIVYMICRSPDRAFKAQKEIIDQTKNHNVHVLLGDCGLEADIRRLWEEFQQHQRTNYQFNPEAKLDVLVCNAGALLNHRTLTSEGVEVTFATHLLFGTYLLGSLALPLIKSTTNGDGRLIVVSSGGMYNTKFPSWEVATSTGLEKYDGQFAYSYAKRGQVLLCERWAEANPDVTVVSCHPGWTLTEGVEKAYGESKSYLEPLRTLWQGAEGIVWLAIAPKDQIKSGEYYLDRSPQPKHLSGPFFTEGSYTKNTKEEVDTMMNNLEAWTTGHRPSAAEIEERLVKLRPVESLKRVVDLQKEYMGDWYVLGNIPTPLEVGVRNGIERYTWDDKHKLIKVTFDYYAKGSDKPSQMKMRASVANDPINTHWKLDPKIFGIPLPLGLDYLIIDLAEDNSYTIVGVPDRSYLWIMIRDIPSEYINTNVPIKDAYTWDEEGKSSEGEEGKEELTVQELKIRKEKEIVRRSLATASRLGIDVDKIIRVPWVTTT